MNIVKFVTFREGDNWRTGIEQGGSVLDIRELGFEGTLKDLLSSGQKRAKALLAASEMQFSINPGSFLNLSNLHLGPPIRDPDKILCIGLNYRDHAIEVGVPIPKFPVVFAKFRNCLIGAYDKIELPETTQEADYEGELAVIIGQRCSKVVETEALSYVAGYSVFNDVSARDLQFQASQWTMGKAIDTFGPIGPGLVPASSIPDPQAIEIVTRLNGETVQQGSTRDMIFGVAYLIAFFSQIMTLEPGDIIATGTPAGVGFTRKPQIFLKPGDIVEVEILQIGKLRNEVIRREFNR